MTGVFITIDTELSLGRHRQGLAPRGNLLESIFGVCGEGTLGISHQICRLDAYGLKAVFFVDPMPAQAFGLDLLKRIVAPILEAGHDVQLHIHTEWLPYLPFDPVDGRRADNIGSFSLEDQLILLEMATELLVAAGAPEPVAFRAGNYGADDNTLRALARLGLRYDTSFNPGYLGDRPRLSLPLDTVEPVLHHDVVEFPVSCIADRPGGLRPAQLCALSVWEMRAALRHAVASRQRYFTLVSHSFELLSRDRQRANRAVVERFERLCAFIADPANGLKALTYGQLDPAVPAQARPAVRLSPNLLRTAHRMGAQLLATVRYERAAGRARARPPASAILPAESAEPLPAPVPREEPSCRQGSAQRR